MCCQSEKVLSPIDAQILELTLDDAIEDHADQYQENIQGILDKLNKAMDSGITTTPRMTAPPTQVAIEAGATTRERAAPSTPGSKVKLPKLTLPHFNSTPLRWMAFWDSYVSAIHGNDELSEVDKFNYHIYRNISCCLIFGSVVCYKIKHVENKDFTEIIHTKH